MIIDFHVHMAIERQGMWTPAVWVLLREHYPERYDNIHLYESDSLRFRDDLRMTGIQKVVLLAEDSIETGIVPNDYILEYSREDPDFFIPFLTLNPNKTGSFRNTTHSTFENHLHNHLPLKE